ncbi:transforming acidic coiled-coil-containing protein 2 isoform X2 [Microcaecilia unicolor]|uniref:Transforming acidic coiled-coil-containing protein 2 isoform X2 n=1 Tax=Microcaecilia unicolor TaxID=1415580 RepID=A0A6P7Y6S8_9AMPH|nr:transforming acidic coiled-coil-containing protein 2 isoform X2 [Microcaecilia unicolor]
MGNEGSSADNQPGVTGDIPLPPDLGTHQESSSPKPLQAESVKSSEHGQTIKKKKQRKKGTEKSVNQDISHASLTFPTDKVPSLVAHEDNQDIPLPNKQISSAITPGDNQDISTLSLGLPIKEISSAITPGDNQDISTLNLGLPIKEISSAITPGDNQDISTPSLGLPIKEIFTSVTSELSQETSSLHLGLPNKEILSVVPDDNQDIPRLNLWFPTNEISFPATPEDNLGTHNLSPGLPTKENSASVSSEISHDTVSLNLRLPINEFSEVSQDTATQSLGHATNEIFSGENQNTFSLSPIKDIYAPEILEDSQHTLNLSLDLPINDRLVPIDPGDNQDTVCLSSGLSIKEIGTSLTSGVSQDIHSLNPGLPIKEITSVISDNNQDIPRQSPELPIKEITTVISDDNHDTSSLSPGLPIKEITTVISDDNQDTSSLSPGLPIKEITSVISDDNWDTSSLKSGLPIKQISSVVTSEDKQDSPNLNLGALISEITASLTSGVSYDTPSLILRPPISELSSSGDNLNIPINEISHPVKPGHEQDISSLKTPDPLDEKCSSEVTGTRSFSCEDVKERDRSHSEISTGLDPALLFASPGSSESEKCKTVDTSGIRKEGNGDGEEATPPWKLQATSSVAGHMPQDEGQLTPPVKLPSFLETKQCALMPAEDNAKQCANLSCNANAETSQPQELILPMPVSDVCRGTETGKQNNAVVVNLENHSVGAFLNISDNSRAEDGRVISCCPAQAGVTQESQQTHFREAGLLQGEGQLGVKCQSAVCPFPPGKDEDYISTQEAKQDSGGRKSATVTDLAAESTDGPEGLRMNQMTAETPTGQSEVPGDGNLPGSEAMTVVVHELAVSADKRRQMESCAVLPDLSLSPAVNPGGPYRCQDGIASSLQQMTHEKHDCVLERDASGLLISPSPNAVALSLEEEVKYAALSVTSENQKTTCCLTEESFSLPLLPVEGDALDEAAPTVTLNYESKLSEMNCGEMYARKFEGKNGAPLTEGGSHLPEDKALQRQADGPSVGEKDGSLGLSLSWDVEAEESFCEHRSIDDDVSETPSEAQSKSEEQEMLKSAEEMTRKECVGAKELRNTVLATLGANVQEVISSLELKQPYFPDTKVHDAESKANAKDVFYVEQVKAEDIYGHNEEQARMCETRGKIDNSNLELSSKFALISIPVKHDDKIPDQEERALEEDLHNQSYLTLSETLKALAEVSASDHTQLLGMIQKTESKPLAEEKQSIFSGNDVPEIPKTRASSKAPAEGEETSCYLGYAETTQSSCPNAPSQHEHVPEEHKHRDLNELLMLKCPSDQSNGDPPKDIIVHFPMVSVSQHGETKADTPLEPSQVSLAVQGTSGGGEEPTACDLDAQYMPTATSSQVVLPTNSKPARSMQEVPENHRCNASKSDPLRDITRTERNLQPEEQQQLERCASTAKNEAVVSVSEKSDPSVAAKSETVAKVPEKSDPSVPAKSETVTTVPEKSDPSVPPKSETVTTVPEKSDPPVPAKSEMVTTIPEKSDPSVPPKSETVTTVPEKSDPSVPPKSETVTTVPEKSDPPVPAKSETVTTVPEKSDPSVSAMSETVTTVPEKSDKSEMVTTVPEKSDPSVPAMSETVTTVPEKSDPPVPVKSETVTTIPEKSDPSVPAKSETVTTVPEKSDSSVPTKKKRGTEAIPEVLEDSESIQAYSLSELPFKDIQFSEKESHAHVYSWQWGEKKSEKECDTQRLEMCTANAALPESQQYQSNVSEVASFGACDSNVSQEDIGPSHTDNNVTSQEATGKVEETHHKCITGSSPMEPAVQTDSRALLSAPRVLCNAMLQSPATQETTTLREPTPGDSEESKEACLTDTGSEGTDPSYLLEGALHEPQSDSKTITTKSSETGREESKKDDAEFMSPEPGELPSPALHTSEDCCLNVHYDGDQRSPLGGVSSQVDTLLSTSLEAEAICNAILGGQKERTQESIVSDRNSDQQISKEDTEAPSTSQAYCGSNSGTRSRQREEEDVQNVCLESNSNHHSHGSSSQDLFSGNNLQVGAAEATDNLINRLIQATASAKSAAETPRAHPTVLEGETAPSSEAGPEASDGMLVDASMETNCTEAVISPKGFHPQTDPEPEKTTDFRSLSIAYDRTNALPENQYFENLPYFVQMQPPVPVCADPQSLPTSGTDNVTAQESVPSCAGLQSLPVSGTRDVTTQKPVPALARPQSLLVSATHDKTAQGAPVESAAEPGPCEEAGLPEPKVTSPVLHRDVEPLASDSRELKKGQRRSSDSEEAFETPESTTPVKAPPSPPPPLPALPVAEEIPRSQLPSEDTGLGSISDTISATDVSQAESVDENSFRPPSRSFSVVFDEDKPIASSGTYNLDFDSPCLVDPFLSSPSEPGSPGAPRPDSKVKVRRKSSDSLPVSRSTLSRSLSLQASDFENSSCLGSSEASIIPVDIPSTGNESAPSTLKRSKKSRPPSLKKKQTAKKSEETKDPPLETSNIDLQVEESAIADIVPESETKPICADVLEIAGSNSELSVEPPPSLPSHSPLPPVSGSDSKGHKSPLTTRRNASPPPAAEVLEVIPPDTEGPENISVKGQAIRLEFDYSEEKEDVQEKSHTSKKLGKKPTAKMPQRKPKTKKVAERLDSDPIMPAKPPVDSSDIPISTGSYTLDIDKWDDPNFNPFSSGSIMQESPKLAHSVHKTEAEDSSELCKPSPKGSSSLPKASASFEIPSSTSETHEHEGETPTKSAKKKKTPLKTVKKSPKRSPLSDASTQEETTCLSTPESPPFIPMVEHATDEEKLASTVSSQKWVAMDIATKQQDYPEPSDLSSFVQENKLHSLADDLDYGNTYEVEYMEKIGSSTPPQDDSPKKLPVYLMFNSENGSPEKSPAVQFSDSTTPGSGSGVEGSEVQLSSGMKQPYPAPRTLPTSQGTNGQRPERPKQNHPEAMTQGNAAGNLEELLSPEDSCVSADALLNRISQQASICDAHSDLAPDLAEKNPTIFAQKLQEELQFAAMSMEALRLASDISGSSLVSSGTQREARAAVAEMPLSHKALYPQTVAMETSSTGFLPYQEQDLEQTLQVAQEEIAAKEREALQWKDKYEECRREVVEMRKIVAEYEKTIAQMIEDEHRDKSASHHTVQQLIMEKEQALSDLNSVEKSLADLFRRYEKMKEVLEGFRKNEDVLKKCAQEYLARVKKEEQRYHALKVHAEEKLDRANAEIAQVRTKSEQEQVAYQASLRKEQLKVAALERTLEQKNKEIEELTKICDELIAKMGRS